MESEKELLKIFKGPMKVAMALGYFPLTIQKGSLQFTKYSLPFINCILTTALMVISTVFLFLNTENFSQEYRLETGVVQLAHIAEGYATLLVGLFFKFYGLARIQKTLEFWGRQVQFFEEGQRRLGLRRLQLVTEQLQILSKASTTRVAVPLLLFSLLCVASMIGISFSLKFLFSAGTGNTLQVIFFAVYFHSSFTSSIAHPAYRFWPITFIRMYSALFEALNLELNCFSISLKTEQNSRRLQYKYSCEYHQREIFIPEEWQTSMRIRQQLSNYLEFLERLDGELCGYNEFFGVHLFMEIFFCVIILVGHGFFFLLALSEEFGFDQNALVMAAALTPTMFSAFALYDFGTVSSHMTNQALQVARSLESIPGFGLGVEIRHKITLTTQRLQSRPPTVTASGFFNLDRALVLSIMSTIASYLVILVQFRK